MIVTPGDPGLEMHCLRPEQVDPDYWWGEGSVKFRIVSLRRWGLGGSRPPNVEVRILK
jgi:hypothetical protein